MHLADMSWKRHLAELTSLLESTGMQATTKWGKPVYCHAGRNVAMVGGFKHHCGIWFFDGALLDDPLNVLENAQEGKTKAMRHWKFTDTDEVIPADDVRSYLLEAMHNAQEGKRVEVARTEPQGWCQAMQDALDGDPACTTAMSELTPGRQREYNRHVAEAKRASTQQSRIEKIRPLVLKGVGLYDRYR